MNTLLSGAKTLNFIERVEKARRQAIKDRRERKAASMRESELAGLNTKHDLILRKKGKNGRSMSPALFARHAAAADRILAMA